MQTVATDLCPVFASGHENDLGAVFGEETAEHATDRSSADDHQPILSPA